MFVRCDFGIKWENWLFKGLKWRSFRVSGRKGGKNWNFGDGKECVGEKFEVLLDRVGRK